MWRVNNRIEETGEDEENVVEGVVIQDRPANDYNATTKKTVAWKEG